MPKIIICSECNLEKEHKARGLCLQCYWRDQGKKYYQENKESVLEYKKQYYETNKDSVIQQMKNYKQSLSQPTVYEIKLPDGQFYYGSTNYYPMRKNEHLSRIRYHNHENPIINKLSFNYEPEDFIITELMACAFMKDARDIENNLIKNLTCVNKYLAVKKK
jgi:predicted GIY-YIG superfamily endonuclease